MSTCKCHPSTGTTTTAGWLGGGGNGGGGVIGTPSGPGDRSCNGLRRLGQDFGLFGDLGDLWRRIGLGRKQILAMKAKSVIPLVVQDVDGHLSILFLSCELWV